MDPLAGMTPPTPPTLAEAAALQTAGELDACTRVVERLERQLSRTPDTNPRKASLRRRLDDALDRYHAAWELAAAAADAYLAELETR